MRKIIIFIIYITLINFIPPSVLAVSTPSAAATQSARSQEIQSQVNKLVSKLSNDLKKTYVGKIKSVGSVSIVVTTDEGDRTITTNEVTSLYRIRAGSKSEINFTALKSGDDLAAFGTIDPANMEMTAKQIIVKVHRLNIVGTITENQKNIVTVKEFNGPETKVDLSDATILKKNVGTVFSTAKLTDFKPGSNVFIIAYADTPTTLSALKAAILLL